MARNTNSSTFKFEDGQLYYLVKPMGTRINADDDLSLSQRGDEYGTDVPFVYAGKNVTKKPLVAAPDGTLLVTHKSHFDSADPYVVSKGSSTRGQPRLRQLEARRDHLELSLHQVVEQIETELEQIEAIEIAKAKAAEIQAAALAATQKAATGTDDDGDNASDAVNEG